MTNVACFIDGVVPDFHGHRGCVEEAAKSGLGVFAHNIERVRELQIIVRYHRANLNNL